MMGFRSDGRGETRFTNAAFRKHGYDGGDEIVGILIYTTILNDPTANYGRTRRRRVAVAAAVAAAFFTFHRTESSIPCRCSFASSALRAGKFAV